MDFSRNQFSDRLKAFNVLTHGFIFDDKDEEIRKYLKRIIITGHKLVTNKIKDEDIDFDIYDVVTLLTANNRPYMREYLENVNPKNITDHDYKSLNSVLTSMIEDNANMF